MVCVTFKYFKTHTHKRCIKTLDKWQEKTLNSPEQQYAKSEYKKIAFVHAHLFNNTLSSEFKGTIFSLRVTQRKHFKKELVCM
jgi:hypothetical protein